MFGQSDDNQQAAAQPAQNPSMLDNVSTQDLQGQPSADPAGTTPVDPQASQSASQHPLTTDNPFVATPAQATAAPTTSSDSTSAPVVAPSEPAAAPVFDPAAAPATDDDTSTPASPVDQGKLAEMKKEAMTHLEPLVDHIDGSPEETFRTTMMMIQASDNHSLLDKALAAAKSIEDDKARAEALLDIINEINYFAQSSQTS